ELAQQLDLPSVLHRPSCISSTRRWAWRHAPLFLFVANRSLSCDGAPTRPIQAKKDFQTNAEPTGKERRTNGRAVECSRSDPTATRQFARHRVGATERNTMKHSIFTVAALTLLTTLTPLAAQAQQPASELAPVPVKGTHTSEPGGGSFLIPFDPPILASW